MAITMKEALDILEGSDWVKLRFITADALRGTGGQVIELPKCRLAKNRQPKQAKSTTNTNTHSSDNGLIKRNPNHNYHFTRNVELPNTRLVKFHPPLLTHIHSIPIL